MNKLKLMSIYWTPHLTIRRYIFFSSTHGTLTKIDYPLSCTEILNWYNWIDSTLTMFFDHKAIKLEVNIQKYNKKKVIYLKLKIFWVSVQTKLVSQHFSPPGNHKKAIRRTKAILQTPFSFFFSETRRQI